MTSQDNQPPPRRPAGDAWTAEDVARLFDVPADLIGWRVHGATDGTGATMFGYDDSTTLAGAAVLAAAGIQLDEIDPTNLRAALNGAAITTQGPAMQTADERHQFTRPPQDVIDHRLASHCCASCGIPLSDDGPDATFCGDICQTWWHLANVDLDAGAPVERLAPPMPLEDVRPGAGETPPSWLGDQRGGNQRRYTPPQVSRSRPGDERPMRLIPVNPESPPDNVITEWDATQPPPDLSYDGHGIWVVAQPIRPGMLAALPAGPGPWDELRLGPVTVSTTRYALEEIDPEPEPSTPWPNSRIRSLRRAGWHYADVPTLRPQPSLTTVEALREDAVGDASLLGLGLLPDLRHCPSCGQATEVECRPQIGPSFHYQGEITQDEIYRPSPGMRLLSYRIDWAPTRAVCCTLCTRPYPGPSVIPLVRRTAERRFNTAPGWYTYALASDAGWAEMTVNLEALSDDPARMQALIWGDVWQRYQNTVSTYSCAIPTHTHPTTAQHWVALGADLAWQGWQWLPTDGEVLRLGLCPEHWYEMQRSLYGRPYDQRIRHPHLGTNPSDRRIRIQ